MLLWIIIALGFVACVIAWQLWQGITWDESASLFIAAALVFAYHLNYIYDRATTDHYYVTGYVTSIIHRPPFSYKCGKDSTCHEPERWILEQRPNPATKSQRITRAIHHGDGIENCFGECLSQYSAPFSAPTCCGTGAYSHAVLVNSNKYHRSKIGDISVSLKSYYNPVMASDDVVYDDTMDAQEISYFPLDDFNKAHRIVAAQKTPEHKLALENLNASLAGTAVSLGIIVTDDTLYFEKLKRAWHRGKANDFVVVINSPDGKAIRNVNILAWNNYTLQQNVVSEIMSLPSVDLSSVIKILRETFESGPAFTTADFSNYHFVDVKIPTADYVRILIFQGLFCFYMLLLLRLNPNIKDYKVPLNQIARMWNKHFKPPENSWYFHALTPTGLILYLAVPFAVQRLIFI